MHVVCHNDINLFPFTLFIIEHRVPRYKDIFFDL